MSDDRFEQYRWINDLTGRIYRICFDGSTMIIEEGSKQNLDYWVAGNASMSINETLSATIREIIRLSRRVRELEAYPGPFCPDCTEDCTDPDNDPCERYLEKKVKALEEVAEMASEIGPSFVALRHTLDLPADKKTEQANRVALDIHGQLVADLMAALKKAGI